VMVKNPIQKIVDRRTSRNAMASGSLLESI
jgi:hypothetical protein